MMKFCRYLLVATAPVWAQPVSPTINGSPSREFGQPTLLPSGLNSVAPNLVEGRELNGPYAVAFDTSASPPILYIADTFNNRVLAYQNSTAISVCHTGGGANCGSASLVLGQRDLTGTLPGGPGSPGLSVGFSFPTGLAVDAGGNVYVADAQNNRIMRFPSPFKQTSSLLTPDLLIGQANFNSNQPNQGQNLPNAQTLSFSSSNLRQIGLAIEPGTGALWVTDPGNNRVLRFPVSQLAPNTNQPAADLVLGQTSLNVGTLASPPAGVQAFLVKTLLNQPTSLAFDASDNLYVSDGYGRILYFPTGFSTGISASRILGLLVQQSPPLPNVNQYQLGAPGGMAASGNNLYVSDVANNRVVEYGTPGSWPAEPNFQNLQPGQQISPPMTAVVGQGNFNSGSANQAHAQPSANTLANPTGIAFSGTDLWVADASNNRVLDFPQQSGIYVGATRLVGQLDFSYSAPNLIEGREVFFTGTLATAGGIAVDHNSTPPHLYIADTNNNRILCFKDARTLQSSSRADMVLGQSSTTDFFDNLINSGTNSATTPTQTGLFLPIGVVVDKNGDLWVADSGNGRVLRYPSPFAQASGSQQLPNLVLGQTGFFTPSITDATNQNMHSPWGITLLSSGSVVVSDVFHNRVLVFKKPSGGDFTNGQTAAVVLGQANFSSAGKSTAISGMASPTNIAVDSSDRVYVCDTGNNRVLVFNDVPDAANGAPSSYQLNGLNQPQGIAIPYANGSPFDTGEIWIANTGSNLIYRLPQYDTLILNASSTNYPITAQISTQTGPLSLALDDSDNVIVAEQANRITFFFALLKFGSLASYNNAAMAPGELAFLGRAGLDFNLTQVYNAQASSGGFAYPWPTTEPVNDIQIMVTNGSGGFTAAPMFRIDQTFISFQVPTSTPASGQARFILMHPSTGEILGEGDFQMEPYAPAFWTSNSQGTGQVAAFNNGPEYSSCSPQPACLINGPSNAIPRDGTHTISFCLTGGGVFQNGPADGQPPTGQAPTAVPPQLLSVNGFLPSGQVPPADVTYSGAGCGFAGGWQVNFLVPQSMPVSANNVIAITLGGVSSNLGSNGQTIQVWFATK